MPKIPLDDVPVHTGSGYPPPYDEPCRARRWQALGTAAGLTQFGVNLMRIPPGTSSSQRHWHAVEDEFAYVLDGELILVEDGGEMIVRTGDAVAWKGGVRNGHVLQNRSDREATVLVVGSRRDDDWGEYSDVDMMFHAGRYSGANVKTRKDGTPF